MSAISWMISPGDEGPKLEAVEVDLPAPKPGEARVKLLAAALNYRDLLVAAGHYPMPVNYPVCPASDACWEVIAVGDGVTRVKPGDRAISAFFGGWIDGDLEPWMVGTTFGAENDGVLMQQRNIVAERLIPIGSELTDAQAACLPCAGATAWNALFETGKPVCPGQSVLTIGTGAVSLLSIQLAKAAGARVIALSSSAEKLERANELGADALINYCGQPKWSSAVREATNGQGVDVIVEVGGPGTLEQSMASLASGGRIALVGFLSDPTGAINPLPLIAGGAKIEGIATGSRRHAERLLTAIVANQIKPVIGESFSFDETRKAYEMLLAGGTFGKIIIEGDGG